MKRRITLIILTLLLAISAYPRPARKGIIALTQPDGTIIEARITGDEFSKLTTTLQGSAIMQDKEGWWCYATFDAMGERDNSGWRIGSKVPQSIIIQSRNIPYRKLSERVLIARGHTVPRTLFPGDINTFTKSGTTPVRHSLIIPVQFNDTKLTYGRRDFINLLTETGYSRNGAMGSAKEYFDAQFGGAIEFLFDVSDIVTLQGKMADYGENKGNGDDKDPVKMVIEACRAIDGETDFSIYDNDGDGEIDNVFIFFAGGDEADGAGDDCIWSHAWYVKDGEGENVDLDGKILNSYACSSELTRRRAGGIIEDVFTGIGTFCHEYSHTLGLPDMYDTDYEGSGGHSAGLWLWTALMDGGNQNLDGNCPPSFNVIEREILGLCTPAVIERDGSYSLSPVGQSNSAYRINTDDPDEYYLLECRKREGWDTYIGGGGMLIYHIDRSSRNSGSSDRYKGSLSAADRWAYANEVNCRPDHQCADLLEADGRQDSFSSPLDEAYASLHSDIRGIFFPSGNVDFITPEGKPGFIFWSGMYSPASIYDIRSGADGVTFKVRGLSEPETVPKASDIQTDIFTDAAIIRFESSSLFEGESVVEWHRNGQPKESATVSPYRPGRYAITIEGLEPGGKTYTVAITFRIGDRSGETRAVTFMTQKASSAGWPYIHLGNVARNEDDTFAEGVPMPLRVVNASDAESIRWTFNGSPAVPEADGYFRVHENGLLKAEIIYRDGSVEKITKEIRIWE